MNFFKPSFASKDPQERKLAYQLLKWRLQYKKGTIPQDVLNTFEKNGASNWLKPFSNEENSNNKTHELCKWVLANNRLPSRNSNNKIEARNCNFLIQIKKSKRYFTLKKHSPYLSKWYDSNQTIAESYGLSKIFDSQDLEVNSNNNCHEVCQWVVSHNGKLPTWASKDIKEKHMGAWIQSQRQALEAKPGCTFKFYPSNIEICKSYGLPNIFERVDLEKAAIIRLNKILDELDKTGASNPSSVKDQRWISLQKGIRANTSPKGNHYTKLDEIAVNRGYPDIFKTVDEQQTNIENAENLSKWILDNKRYPKLTKTYTDERKMGQILYQFRHKNKTKELPDYVIDILNKNGVENCLDDLESRSNLICKQLCDFVNKENRYPNPRSSNNDEKILGNWFRNAIKAKRDRALSGQKKHIKQNNFYPSNLKICEQEGLPNLLDGRPIKALHAKPITEMSNAELKSNALAEELCLFVIQNNRYPIYMDKELQQLVTYMGKIQKQKEAYKFFESDIVVFKKYNLESIVHITYKELKSNDMCMRLCNYIREKNKFPDTLSTDPEVRSIATWYRTQLHHLSLGVKFYHSNIRIATDMGFPDLFK